MERWRIVSIHPVWSVLFLILQNAVMSLEFEVVDFSGSVSITNGKKQIDQLIQHSKMPVGHGSGPSGNCWKSALDDLEIGCKFLTEEVQSRMALRFTSCFNEMFGTQVYICEKKTPIQTCLQQLNSMDRQTFKDYFLHTQDMCYYLRQEVWQEQTNDAVSRLTDAASDVTNQMEEQKLIQEQIYQSQQESLKVQSNMKKDNEDLYNAVVKVKDVFDDFSVTTREHQLITTEIFDKLSRMQKLVSWIQGEMSLFDAVFFYFGAIVLGFFATATSRTRAARFWLVCLFMAAIWCENALHKYLKNSDYGMDLHPEDIQYYIWVLRKTAAAFASLLVFVAAALYRDPQHVHNSMIANMHCSLEKLSQFIKEDLPKRAASAVRTVEQGDDASSEDSYDNYSSDESEDNLEHELKTLSEDNEDFENTENVAPASATSPSLISRYFGKESYEVTPTPPSFTGMQNHRYNLRERSTTPRENPILQEESVTQFARLVKRRRTPKPKSNNDPSINNVSTRYNYFSSDDDEQ